MKILLIEDDELMRDMITMVLAMEGHEVSGAATGEVARALFNAGGYAAVISDMYLPDTDGFELFAELKAVQPELLFLLLSGETDEAVLRKAAALGIPYIEKDENFAERIAAALK
ncbi:response regulator [Azotosporobacter soli]|uniref:response regulator n=1 Tax=Azotosporobacter soli TaxID=3055040 RepID=UPI0031FF0B7D